MAVLHGASDEHEIAEAIFLEEKDGMQQSQSFFFINSLTCLNFYMYI